jgi:hypothetical protein
MMLLTQFSVIDPKDLSHFTLLMTLWINLVFSQWINLFVWILVFHTMIFVLIGHTICRIIQCFTWILSSFHIMMLVHFGCISRGSFSVIDILCSLVLLQLTTLLQWLLLSNICQKPPFPSCGTITPLSHLGVTRRDHVS